MLVEIRAYRLRPGAWPEFRRLFIDAALPLLARHRVDVIAFGASLEEPDSAFLVRAFADPEDRIRTEDAFYASPEWRQGPREPILACIETFVDTVLALDDATVDGLRRIGIATAT